MPGGMGGMGGLAGMLLGGGGGMGGLGGGMPGMGGMGGMGQSQTTATQTTTTTSNEYDVDRWQRADGLDATSPTMVQTVRADWDAKKAEQEEKNPLKRLANKFKKKKASGKPTPSEERRPGGGTVVTPEMKKALRTHAEPDTPPPAAAAIAAEAIAPTAGRNYLGLDIPTSLDGFFTSNPLNSAYLAVDSLGLGMLALNQILPTAEPLPPVQAPLPAAPAPTAPAAPQTAAPTPGPAPRQNLIAQRSDTRYMNEFHQSREQQKYQVRIT